MEKNRVIHALDVEDKVKALRIVKAIKDFVDAVKISYPLILMESLKIVGKIKEYSDNLPLILDFKVADIPSICEKIVNVCGKAGVDGIIVHGFTGSDSVKACVEAAKKWNLDVYVVVEMSHPGSVEFFQPVGEKIAEMAKNLGATGIVAPATRPERIKRYRFVVGEEMVIISPGVGVQGGKPGDAILHGANFEIVGRLIYESPNPRKTAQEISQKIRESLHKI
ncbi:MAG: orotidine-5'-phosphate decarboxylase [Candidatus Bathyarchaeota archaeon]|nr:orotidine-5'-phosphate decarboxylase [Candidatus Bathyarchaeota archaeon]